MAIYMWRDYELITTKGIYWNEEKGLISLSGDGSTWYTMADKNLGATKVYNAGDDFSQANCGFFYQWGNNYGFPYRGYWNTTSTSQVNAGTYSPSNYYNSSTFIIRSSTPRGWDSSGNANLWGDTTNTNVARRGPCDEGFHVPTNTEWVNVATAFTQITSSTSGLLFSRYLKMPHAGDIYFGTASHDVMFADGKYWSSTNYNTDSAYMMFFTNGLGTGNSTYKSYGLSIRPFPNTVVQPTTEWIKLNP